MTARDKMKPSDLAKGPRRTPPKRRAPNPTGITDHAVLRYLERVMGVDVEAVRRAILTPDNKALIARLKSGKFPIGAGMLAVVVDEVIVTITPAQ